MLFSLLNPLWWIRIWIPNFLFWITWVNRHRKMIMCVLIAACSDVTFIHLSAQKRRKTNGKKIIINERVGGSMSQMAPIVEGHILIWSTRCPCISFFSSCLFVVYRDLDNVASRRGVFFPGRWLRQEGSPSAMTTFFQGAFVSFFSDGFPSERNADLNRWFVFPQLLPSS